MSQQPWGMELLEWQRVRQGLLEVSGTGLYGIKEASGRGKRQLAGLPRYRVREIFTAPMVYRCRTFAKTCPCQLESLETP